MMNIVRTLLESSPLLALFLAIATGYAIGQISFAGVSFGAGAVLFTGLIIGAIAPKAAPPGMVGTLGLVMFVYGVGIQYGPQFFASLRGPGIKYIALAAVAVIASLVVAMLLAGPLGISLGDGGRTVRRFRHEHADPAGGPGSGGQPGSRDRLLGVLSVRRDRSDRPDDHHGGAGQTQVQPAATERPRRRVDPRARNAGSDGRRTLCRTAGRRQDRRRPPQSRERCRRLPRRYCRRVTGCCWPAAPRASNRPRRPWGERSQDA